MQKSPTKKVCKGSLQIELLWKGGGEYWPGTLGIYFLCLHV
jgi:hypothetical protein